MAQNPKETIEYWRTTRFPLLRLIAHTPLFVLGLALLCFSFKYADYHLILGLLIVFVEGICICYYAIKIRNVKHDREPALVVSPQGLWIRDLQETVRWQDVEDIKRQWESTYNKQLFVAMLAKHTIQLIVRDKTTGKQNEIKIVREEYRQSEDLMPTLTAYWKAYS